MESTLTPVRDVRAAEPSPVEAASLVGTTLADRYRLLEVIGQGGIGYVFRAQHLVTNRAVALKILRPEFAESPHLARRFEREAQVTSQLAHPNIVEIIDFGGSNGRLFLAMEFLQGMSLADLVERGDPVNEGRLTVERTIAIIRQVLLALEHAHSCGVVHRDLKPENIMLIAPRGLFSRERVKLLDFGIAKPGDFGDGSPKLTQAGLALGTPRYMSPEQAMGRETDARSDLYSCGVILYEILTGRPPFESESMTEVLSMHLTAQARPLRTVAPSARIPVALESVVLRALAKEPAQRFQSARELRVALEGAARSRDVSGFDETVLALKPARAAPSPIWMRAQKMAIAIIGAALLIADCRPARHETLAAARAPDAQDPAKVAVRAAGRAVSEEPARSRRLESHIAKPRKR